jgi:hypothetical protein
MNDLTSILEEDRRRIGAAGKRGAIVKRVRGSVYVLVLVAFFLAVGVGGRPGSDAHAAEVKVLPTGNIAPTATLAPEPDADRRNEDVAQVTLLARFKAH